MFSSLLKNEFFRNVFTLVSGTTIAQAIPIVVAPLLTRIYSPAEFGIFAVYFALVSVISVLATGRYALAIMLPDDESDAASIGWLSIGISIFVAIISLIVLAANENRITQLLGAEAVGLPLLLAPVSIFMFGAVQALNYWNNRAKEFGRLAKYRIIQSTVVATVQLVIGYYFFNSMGLIYGFVTGQAAALLVLMGMVWTHDRPKITGIKFAQVIANAKTYKKFPLFSMWGALANNAGSQMPVFVLTRFFSTSVSGMFSLTFRILNLPISLIAGSLSQVLFQRVVEIKKTNPEALQAYVVRIFFYMLIATIPFVIIVSSFGEQLFTFVFGEQWVVAGRIAEWMVFAVAIRFCVSPLSVILAMDHTVKLGAFWQILYFITVTTVLFLSVGYSLDTFVKIYVLHEITLYLFYFYLIIVGIRKKI